MFVGVLPQRCNNGIDADLALKSADGIDAAMDLVEYLSERVRDLVKRDELDCILVPDPLKGHAGYICT